MLEAKVGDTYHQVAISGFSVNGSMAQFRVIFSKEGDSFSPSSKHYHGPEAAGGGDPS